MGDVSEVIDIHTRRPESTATPEIGRPTEFEGLPISGCEISIPGSTVELDESYLRGTHLVFQVQMRVKNIRYEEDRGGQSMTRRHLVTVEEVRFVRSFPEGADNTVTSPTEPVTGDAADVINSIGRTADKW